MLIAYLILLGFRYGMGMERGMCKVDCVEYLGMMDDATAVYNLAPARAFPSQTHHFYKIFCSRPNFSSHPKPPLQQNQT
jgi:hypothetical protein